MIVLFSLCLVILGVRQAKYKSKQVKILDWKSDGYPIDMSHNDEREWSLMLRALYR